MKFYLDDPQRKATPFSLENEISWDFARTAANKSGCTTCADSPAYPFESNLLSIGTHTVTAVVDFKDGRPQVVLNATVTIADTTAHSLLVSTKADRGGAGALNGATLSGNRYVFLGAAQDSIVASSGVKFVLDGKAGLTEAMAPYDLMATASDGKAKPLDTKTLTVGKHTLEAIVLLPEGTQYQVHRDVHRRSLVTRRSARKRGREPRRPVAPRRHRIGTASVSAESLSQPKGHADDCCEEDEGVSDGFHDAVRSPPG